jgi:hypothetical protein
VGGLRGFVVLTVLSPENRITLVIAVIVRLMILQAGHPNP